jgi:hypothetical protein
MKNLCIFLILNLVLVLAIAHTQLPEPPKAANLRNHFGTKPSHKMFGPAAFTKGMNIVRRGRLQGEDILPIENIDEEILPEELTSGTLDNTSRDATKIIRPEVANPKVHINTNLTHNTVVKTPVHVGNQLEKVTVKTLNRETGIVNVEKTTQTKPILAVLETAKEVHTKVETLIDVDSGIEIKPDETKTLLGTDSIEADRLRKLEALAAEAAAKAAPAERKRQGKKGGKGKGRKGDKTVVKK